MCIRDSYNILDINHWLTPLYAHKETSLRGLQLQTNWARTIGTIGNPNKYGYFMLICISLSFVHILNKRRLMIHSIIYFISTLSLIYTLSRTSILTFIIIMIAILFVFYKKSGNLSRILRYVLISGCILLIISGYFITEGVENRLLKLDTSSYMHSKYARIRDFKLPYIVIYRNPQYLLFGKGPSKDFIKTSLHNDYSWMLERYGIIALFAYLLLIYRGNKYSYKYYNMSNNFENDIPLLTVLSIFIIFFIYAFAEDVFKDVKIMSMNMVFMAIISNYHYSKKQHMSIENQ